MRTEVNPQEAAAQATATAWADVGIEPVGAAPRLAPEQPEHGLLWVTRGAVTVARAGRAHEIRKGTVVAYRLGPDLTWAAASGAHVRWCRRDVSVGAGQVAPWTTDLAIDGPIAARPAHRGLYATLTVALSWVVAITVAWCYDRAHADETEARIQRAVQAIPAATDEQALLLEDLQRSIFEATGESVKVISARGGAIWVETFIPVDRRGAFVGAIREVAAAAFDRHVMLGRVDVSIGDPGKPIDEWVIRFSILGDGTISLGEGMGPLLANEPWAMPSVPTTKK